MPRDQLLGGGKTRLNDVNTYHRSKGTIRPKLSDISIRCLIRQLEGGRNTKVAAGEIDVTQRHVRRLWAEHLKTETAHIQRLAGRPKSPALSDEEVQMVLDAHHPGRRAWCGRPRHSRRKDMI